MALMGYIASVTVDPPLAIEDATQRSQPVMRTVTQRLVAAVLATTEEHPLAGID